MTPETFLGRLWELDDQLARAWGPSHIPLSTWWRSILEQFYRAGKRSLVIRKGRRIGASTIVAPRLAVLTALAVVPTLHVPPGDEITLAFVSVRREEAGKRLRGIAAILDTLGLEYDTRGEAIYLRGTPCVFKVLTANWRTAVGDTIVFLWCDEVARWADSDTGANPASEVLASLRPTLATIPAARMFLVSSPMGFEDSHAEAFARGETADQSVAFCESWIGNPTLSEEQTHLEEPNKNRWAREWAGRPSAAESACWDRDLILACVREVPGVRCQPVGLLDLSGGASDATTWGTGGYLLPHWQPPTGAALRTYLRGDGEYWRWWQLPDGTWVDESVADRRPLLTVHALDGIRGWAGTRDITDIYGDACRFWTSWGCQHVYGDQWYARSVESALKQHGLGFEELNMRTEKAEGVNHVSHLLASHRFVLPNEDRIVNEMIDFQEKITGNSIRYEHPNGKHDDYATLAICLALADLHHGLSGSPIGHRTSRKFIRSIEDRQRGL